MFERFPHLFKKLTIYLTATKICNMHNKILGNINEIEVKILSKITLQLSKY